MPAPPADVHLDTCCPRCQSNGAVLFRALRSSAIYLCRDCDHEWEIDGTGMDSSPTPDCLDGTARS